MWLVFISISEIETVDVSAEGSVDYSSIVPYTRDVIFTEGEETYTFNVPIENDDVVEQIESFQIRLFDMIGGQIGHPNTANVFIENDDGKDEGI